MLFLGNQLLKKLFMNNRDLIELLYSKILEAQEEKIYREEIYESISENIKSNQFLFFIKPEITLESDKIKLKQVLELIFRKMHEFDFSIVNCKILTASYLDEYDIIAQHYGVINKASNDAQKYLSPVAQQKFEELYGVPVEKTLVSGSLEFLNTYPVFNPVSLDYMWQNSLALKLGGGIYAQKIKLDGKEQFLINGFHPRQLRHFTEKGRSIVTFTLESNTDWQVAREQFVGKTNPNEAVSGSIRNELLVHSDELGLSNISSSWNGVHLSAGPVEGLIELIRYNSDFQKNEISTVSEYSFGKRLLSVFSKQTVDGILENPTVTYKNKPISIYDLTEEKNSDDAVRILKEVYR